MKSRQRGQAMPLGIALILFGILGGLVLFNTGQTATDKTRLANAADAAAYSGVLWQARALNFQSYTNRAMVANQVTIGQAVSIQSWARYATITSGNIKVVTAWVPFLNAITSGLAQAATTLDNFLVPIGDAMVAVVDGVNRGLSVSQDAMFASSFAATPDIVRTVASTSDDRFTADTGYSVSGLYRNLYDWNSFTDNYSPAEREDREAVRDRTLLIGESTDDFTRERNWKLFSPMLYTSPFTRHQINREGETRLIEAEGPNGELQYEWKAKDTIQLRNEFLLLVKNVKVDVPVGWAEAIANESGGRTIETGAGCQQMNVFGGLRIGVPVCGGQWLDRNKKSETLADLNISFNGVQSQIKTSGYTGIQAFRSLSEATLENKDPKLLLRVEVAMHSEDLADSSKSVSGEKFSAPVVAPGEILSSISIAEVYYQRPDNVTADLQTRSRKVEYANGYNPYWDVRLSSIPERERLLALALRPGGLSTSVPDGLEVANAGSELGSYVEDDPLINTLANADETVQSGIDGYANAYDVPDLDSLRGEAQGYADQGSEQLDSVVAQLDVDLQTADDIKNTLKTQLEDELKDSVKSILAGITGSNTGQNVQGVIDDLKAEADDLKALIPEEMDSLAEFTESDIFTNAIAESGRMQDLNQQASELFQPIAEAAIERADLLKAPLLEKLADPLVSNDDKDAIRLKLREINAELVNHLANKLVETVNDLGVDWTAGSRQTRHIIRELLNERYRDPDTGEIGWELPPDEDAPVPEELDTTEDTE